MPGLQSTVLDLSPQIEAILREEELPYRALFWRYDIHMNDTGNRVFGQALTKELAGRL